MPAVQVRRITVKPDRVVFDLQLAADAPRRTNPQLARQALERRPCLAEHACVNSVGNTFGAVMASTPLPHLVEHVAIDVLAERLAPAEGEGSAVATGTSEWVDRGAGSARVELACPDDLLVLHAFNEAVRIVNELVVG